MKIVSVLYPRKGPRGGLASMGSISLKNDNGDIVWVRVDSPRGWTDGQQKMFEEVLSTLTARFDKEQK
jgi:hypothetical protein